MRHQRQRLRTERIQARWCLAALLILGLLVGCDTSPASSSSAGAELSPSVILTNGGCTYAGPQSIAAEGGRLTIPVSNDSDFVAVATLLKVGSAFAEVEADVNEYNDAVSVGEPAELTLDPGVSSEAEVEVDPAGVGELASDVTPDTYAILCVGAPADSESEGLDEAFLFGPLEVTE
jgi:hypothetical protein